MIGKKANIGELVFTSWAELFFLLLIIVGFILSITIRSPVLSYIVIFCAGLMAGRIITKKIKKQPPFPYFLIVLGFLVGYLIGSFTIDVNRLLLIVIFVAGTVISYIVHKKGYVK